MLFMDVDLQGVQNETPSSHSCMSQKVPYIPILGGLGPKLWSVTLKLCQRAYSSVPLGEKSDCTSTYNRSGVQCRCLQQDSKCRVYFILGSNIYFDALKASHIRVHPDLEISKLWIAYPRKLGAL